MAVKYKNHKNNTVNSAWMYTNNSAVSAVNVNSVTNFLYLDNCVLVVLLAVVKRNKRCLNRDEKGILRKSNFMNSSSLAALKWTRAAYININTNQSSNKPKKTEEAIQFNKTNRCRCRLDKQVLDVANIFVELLTIFA